MKTMKALLLGSLTLALTGCYSFHYTQVDSLFGSSSDTQSLTVNTTPAGAQCNVTSFKDGSTQTTVTIPSTPGKVDIYQSNKSVIVACTKAGYQNAQVVLQPQNSDGAFATTVSLLLQASGS